MVRTLLLLLAGVASTLVLSAAVGASEKVGADRVKPLDLQAEYQDLSNCNLKGVTIDGNVPVVGQVRRSTARILSGANLASATISGGYKPLQRPI